MSDTGEEPFVPSYSNCDGVSELCPVELTIYGDYFTTGACAFFVAAYGVVLIVQSYLGYKSKAWSYVSYLAIGAVFELMGYAGRIAMSYNPWNYAAFVMQMLMLILGPTLVAAAMSITFKHLVLWYGVQWSLLRPSLYPWVFVGTDFISIVIQGAGGAVSSFASDDGDQVLIDVGSALLIAGVAFQVANMLFCGGLMVFYMIRRNRALKVGPARVGSSGEESEGAVKREADPYTLATPEESRKLKLFLYALTVAYFAVIIRCIYRIPEMALGWASELMQNETTFLILDGAMILGAVIILTIFHPHFYFPYLGKKDMLEGRKSAGNTAESHEMFPPNPK